ncbi:hypothetical protein PRIPAC_83196 [Pristionchus pacificus]|uniref:Uncharacterized protein n=1 Tax=Pristionchus pacificus TaxID=54126 RepID=A0A2A6BV25_PRIPA|nr:hypothetical protein PRIPAC_83196 [Pristionchus pacificus]|eukprot:PDM69770.1 hypothetical protein PRIPAC_44866 [Pristionchus pacificus]
MSIKLEDSPILSLTIESAAKSTTKGAPREGGCQTDPIKTADAPCDPMAMGETGTQTDFAAQKGDTEGDSVRLSEEVITRMLQALAEGDKSRKIYERLNTLHDTTRVHLTMMRSAPMQPPPTASIIDIVTGSGDRAVVLLGELVHETWCSHECGLRVINRRKISSILLPTCPTTAGFLERDLVAVGTVGGEIVIVSGDDILSTSKFFSSSVSSLFVPSPGRLVAVSIDGLMKICSLRGVELQEVKSIEVTVANLPRSIRSTRSESDVRIGIVSVSGNDRELCLVSETGGIWTAPLSTLALQSLPAQPQPLAAVLFRPPHLVLHGDDGRVHVCTASCERVDTLPSKAKKVILTPDGNLLIALSATAATPALAFYDVPKRKMIMEIETTISLLAIAAKGRDGILAVAEDAQIVEYDVTRV